MRLLALLALATACASPSDRLIGAWVVDAEALAESRDLLALDEATRQQAAEMAGRATADMTLEFRGEGTLRVALGATRLEGDYRVVAATGETLTVDTTLRMGEQARARRIEVRLVGDRLEVTGPDGARMPFRRRPSP
ncbi:MAG: hypothetical protein R3F60_33045 [bacterium]